MAQMTELLLALFGVLGLAIAAAGVYGMMAYVVTERTQEIGIRMALGAMPSTILLSVLGAALRYLGAGLVIGVMSAWGLTAIVRGFLFEMHPRDPVVYAGVLALLTSTGLAAALLPARRAAAVDPLIALRTE